MKNDVVIVGGGPGGTTAAMCLLNEGVKPLIIEKKEFPRFHIGESLTGAAGKVLRDLGIVDEMYRRRYPTKQGVNVYGKSEVASWFVPVTGRDENWELFPWDTWQVRRSDFDKMMLDQAISRGAEYLTGRALRPVLSDDGAVTGVQVELSGGKVEEIQTEMLLDCSGMATWLANMGGITGPKYVGSYDKQVAFFSHVAFAERDNGPERRQHPDNTLIYYRGKYHWAWFIPIDSEVVSVGVVAPSSLFLEKKESPRDFLLRELKELHPNLSRRLGEIKLVEDVHVVPNYSYQVKGFSGNGWMCIGDAHRFVDPIFSFGLSVAMREAQFVAPAIRDFLGGSRNGVDPFADLRLQFEKGVDVLEDVVDSFWEQPLAFAYCVHAKHTDNMTDMFAGRIYEHERQPSQGLNYCRKILRREGMREKSYESEDLYSVPVGSRYHPERAAIWGANGQVASTEEWMRPR